MGNEISCTKLQLPPEPLTRGLPPPDPRSLCPQLNLLNPLLKKIPGYATVFRNAGNNLSKIVLSHTAGPVSYGF